MRKLPTREAAAERAVPVFLLASLLLVAPASRIWADSAQPWWLVFALWGVLIALGQLAR